MEKLSPSSGGMTTSKNERFVRHRWEIPTSEISTNSKNRADAAKTGNRWFPYLKGGAGVKWIGKGESLVNWKDDGAEIKEAPSYPRSQEYYFKGGLCWSDVDSTGFAARIAPAGAIFDATNLYSATPADLVYKTLGVLNSRVALYVLTGLNPTIHYQVGDIERLPIPEGVSEKLDTLVRECIELTQFESCENERNYQFVLPPRSREECVKRRCRIEACASGIDAEVFRLYNLGAEDLAAIDHELSGSAIAEADDASTTEEDDEEGEDPSDLSPAEIARCWASYAVGTVLGRFSIGEPGGIGRGDFSPEQVKTIRSLMNPEGILPCEKGHPQDLASRAAACLALMLGESGARDTIRIGMGGSGDSVELLRAWLDRLTGTPEKSFWEFQYKLYRKRPIYWPLQSPEKHFTVWVHQERIGKETLFTVKKLADEQLNLLKRRATDLRPASTTNRANAKELDQALEQVDDVTEFINRLSAIIQRGYTSCIDDGVLLNAAPLHPLLPSWPETKKAWQELEAGKYDWARQAMLHWPVRVKDSCKSNQSFAIAHGLA
jgi:hypothetical protein